jgi:hypothetical protein
MLTARMREYARRIVVDELDVRYECDACVETFEEIVGEQRVVGHAVAQRRHERVDVVEPLAGEDALGEQILVRVGHGGRIRIDAGVAGIEAREQRTRRTRERDADARLEDAVAVDHQTGLRIDQRAVQRVRGDADQRARGVARQRRVAVERDAVAHRRQYRCVADVDDEARVLGAAQQAIELLDLPALALPAHPQALPARSTAGCGGTGRTDRAGRRHVSN